VSGAGDRPAKGQGSGAWDSLWRSVGAGEPKRSDSAGLASGTSGTSSAREASGGPGPRGSGGSGGLRLIVRTDGAARGNPGPASCGAVLIDAASPGARRPDAAPIASISEYLGTQTNNVAEYTAVLRALDLAEAIGAREVELLLDSKLIVEQASGRWKVKDAKLVPLNAEVRARLGRFARWSAAHVPRAQNHQADALCNEAIDRVQAGGPRVVVTWPK
jgi:ribonuclease HI